MIFILLAISIPYLAAIGLDKLITNEKKQIVKKKILWVFGGFIGLTFIFLIFGESILSFSSLSDNRFNPAILSPVKDIRKELFNKGIMLALVLSGSTFGLSWLFLKGEVNKKIFSTLIVLFSIADLWVVNNTISVENIFLFTSPFKNSQERPKVDPLKTSANIIPLLKSSFLISLTGESIAGLNLLSDKEEKDNIDSPKIRKMNVKPINPPNTHRIFFFTICFFSLVINLSNPIAAR
jgi:hypothetical protein